MGALLEHRTQGGTLMLRTLGEIPLLWFATAFAAAWLLLRRPGFPSPKLTATAAGLASAALLLLAMLLNVFTAGFLVAFGANILAIAATHQAGQPMYHAPGSGEMYALVYGPYTYLVYEVPRLLGATLAKSELLLVAAAWLLATYRLLRRTSPCGTALALTGFGASCLLAVPPGVLGVRGDLWSLLAVTLALEAIRLKKWVPAAVAAGLCCGFAIGIKPTLAAEALLVLAILWRRHGFRAAVLAAFATAAAALAPFASPSISLRNYLAWLELTGARETFPSLLAANALFALLLFAPAALLGARWPADRHRILAALTGLAVAVAVWTGAKSGGGPWHLWPLLPFALLLAAARHQRLGQRSRIAAAIALAALLVSVRYGIRIAGMERPRLTALARHTERQRSHELLRSGSLTMAPGASMDSDADDLRYLLAAQPGGYRIDMVAAAEALKTRPALLESLVPTVTRCDLAWIVPTGEVPFSTRNNNELAQTYPYVFPDQVRRAFLQTHRLLAQGRFYDRWTCPSAEIHSP